jgi:hypothetical protein
MKKIIELFWALTIMASFILTSCATTKLTGVYKDSTYTGGSLSSVLVVGVAENLRNRKMFEQFFAEQFKNNGVEAFSSADVIPSDKKLDKNTIKSLAEKLGADAVLVTHLEAVEEKEVYIPPVYTNIPDPFNQNLGRHYTGVYGYVHEPGYYVTHKLVRLENNLYETKTEKLIWSSSSETINPASANETIEELCKVVMKSLRDHQLIK